MKKFVMLILAISLATTLAACGDSSDSDSAKKDEETKTGEQANQGVKIGEDEKVDKDKVVVSINDTDIKGDKYNTIYAQTKNLMNQYGQDVSDKDFIKEQAINTIIGQELLTQEAKKQGVELEEYITKEMEGIEVTDKEIKSAYDKIKEENKDIPELKEIKGQIKEGLKQQKGNQILQAKIKELKEDAEIKNMI